MGRERVCVGASIRVCACVSRESDLAMFGLGGFFSEWNLNVEIDSSMSDGRVYACVCKCVSACVRVCVFERE